jgi:DNA repair protein RecN (Recombination protein N)
MRVMLNNTEQFDELIKNQEQLVTKVVAEINQLGALLSKKRRDTAGKFEQTITTVLNDVGMNQARFRVRFSLISKTENPFSYNNEQVNADNSGFDKVIFEIASNMGSQFTPIHKTASGGEISRLMLTLKSVLAHTDRIPSLVFDEIDAGISGKIAQIVGLKLSQLAEFHQILCITHIPQIAAFASNHFKVIKQTRDSNTFVSIKPLDNSHRETEIANLLGGEKLSPQAIENARHLIFESQKM